MDQLPDEIDELKKAVEIMNEKNQLRSTGYCRATGNRQDILHMLKQSIFVEIENI